MTPFKPIASRTLIFKSRAAEKVTERITVAVSAPYSPPTNKAAKANAGCMVLTGGDPEHASEVWGADEIEALQVALAHIQVFLREVANSGKVELRTEDGKPFDPEGSPFLTKYLEATQRT
jgi:hypothetical protein